MSGFKMDDYVDVAERIREFSEKYPEGSLQSELTFHDTGWLCRAYAYRTADDPRPGIGHAFEPVPGHTPYTKDSEAMNAETSAWGRAIVALGFKTKKIASSQEVRARKPTGDEPMVPPREQGEPFTPPTANPARDVVNADGATDAQKKMIRALSKKLDLDTSDVETLSKRDASARITELKALEGAEPVTANTGAGGAQDDIPFQRTFA